jgi:hypothetical protein
MSLAIITKIEEKPVVMPIIFVALESEMGRTVVPGQPKQNTSKNSSQPLAGNDGMSLSSQAALEADMEGSRFPAAQAKKFARLHLNGEKLGIMMHAIPAMARIVK